MAADMDFFKKQENVESYLKMIEGYDNRFMTDLVCSRLPAGSSLLELGMGPGQDMLVLHDKYKVTGSDSSQVFLELFREKYPDADLLQLDAVTLQTDRCFDCIFSNKVLMHLQRDDMIQSLKRQTALLNTGGQLIHSVWQGDRVEEFDGLYFQYYTEETLETVCSEAGLLKVEIGRYTEEEKEDSLWLITALIE